MARFHSGAAEHKQHANTNASPARPRLHAQALCRGNFPSAIDRTPSPPTHPCPSPLPPPYCLNHSPGNLTAYTSTMPTTLQEFESVWPRIRADLQEHCRQYKLPQQSLDWFTKVPPPKTNSGSTLLTLLCSLLTTTPLAENVIVECP